MPGNTPYVTPSDLLDERGLIACDVACVSCGYNLRSLAPGANCPECGAPVRASTSSYLLCCAPPAWVRTLANGARRVANGVVLGLLGIVFCICLMSIPILNPLSFIAVVACSAAVTARGFIGLTTPEPGGPPVEKCRIAAHWLRIWLLSSLSAIVPGMIILIATDDGPGGVPLIRWLGPGVAEVAPYLVGAGLLSLLVALPLMTRRLAVLLCRAQAPRDAKPAFVLSWAQFIATGVLLAGSAVAWGVEQLRAAWRIGPNDWSSLGLLGAVCASLGGLAELILAVFTLSLISACATKFEREARLAEAAARKLLVAPPVGQ